ncbi:MAG: hypothetical protein ABEJ05_08700 [Haloglomus sp.]
MPRRSVRRRIQGTAVGMVVAVANVTGRVTAAGASGREPALRRLVRNLGDGTVFGPGMDAVAAVGPDTFWATLGPVLVGAWGIMLLALGPVFCMVGVLWTYRRLRWVFWTVVGAVATGLGWLCDVGPSLWGTAPEDVGVESTGPDGDGG